MKCPRSALAWLLLISAPIVALGAVGSPAPETAHPAAVIIQRAIQASRDDQEVSRRLADEALGLLATQPNADLEIRARLVLCDYYSERDLDVARGLLERSTAQLSLARRGGLRSGIQSCEGEIHEAAGDNTKALAAYERAVSTAEAAHDDEMLANALYLRGWLRGVQGDFALGLVDLRRAVTLYEKGGLTEHARTAVNGVATIYNRMGDYAQAQRFYEIALKSQLAAGTQREAVVTLYNLGRTLENLDQPEVAWQDYQQALEISHKIGYTRGEAYALRGLAGVHNDRGEWHKSLERLAESERKLASLPDARLHAQIAMLRGIALRGLKRPAEAVASLNAALAVFKKAEAQAELRATYAALAGALADLGDWRGAYEQQRLLQEVADRLHARQLDQRFTTLKVEFDTAARDKENALLLREKAVTEAALEHERRAGRLQVVVIVLAVLLALALAVLAWRLRRAGRRMHTLALTDELTGLPNRRAVLAELARMLDASRSSAVLIIDIDHFKSINDRRGHLVGDEVLGAVASILNDVLRAPATAGRLGGEEFLVVLPETGIDEALQVAERVRIAVGNLDTSRWLEGHALSVSIGVTIARAGTDSVADALRRADEALYEAKAAGRDRVHAGPLVLAA